MYYIAANGHVYHSLIYRFRLSASLAIARLGKLYPNYEFRLVKR